MNQTSNEPGLVSADGLRWWADDADERYDDDADEPPRMAAELLKAREVLTLLAAGVLSVPPVSSLARTIWCPQRGWQPLAAIRPDLAAYLDALEALDQEDS